jgi:hypothetical protein
MGDKRTATNIFAGNPEEKRQRGIDKRILLKRILRK